MGLSIRSSEFSFWFSHCCCMTCEVKSLPFSFLGGKGTPFPLARSLKMNYVKSTAFRCAGYARTKPTMPTNILWEGMHIPPCWDMSCLWHSGDERCGGEAPPTIICYQGTAGLQHHSSRSAQVFPVSQGMYGEHPPAIAFYSSPVLQKQYKMEIVRAQDQGQSLQS